MESYKKYSESSQNMILIYLKKRMKDKKMKQKKLAEILGVSETTLVRYFKKNTPMPLSVSLEICELLKIGVIFTPKESENTEMHKMFFNDTIK